MNELDRYIDFLKIRQENGENVYFSVFSVSETNGNKLEMPLLKVESMGKKATGADLLKKIVDKAIALKCDSVKIKEYSRFDDEKPTEIYEFSLGQNKPKINKKGAMLPKQNTFQGLGAVEETLSNLGFEDGLMGFVQASANAQLNQSQLADTKAILSDVRSENAQLKIRIEQLKEDNERLRDEKKELKEKERDLERDYQRKLEDSDRKNRLGSLMATAVMGFVGNKMNITPETLQGILGGGTSEQEQTQQTIQETQQLNSIDPKNQQIIDYIENYIESIDLVHLQYIGAVIEFAKKSDKNLQSLADFIKNRINGVSTQNQPQENNEFDGVDVDEDEDNDLDLGGNDDDDTDNE